MEESQYHKIREETLVNGKAHSNLVDLIKLTRDKRAEELLPVIEEGQPVSHFSYERIYNERKNMKALSEFDAALDFNLINYKDIDFAGVLKN